MDYDEMRDDLDAFDLDNTASDELALSRPPERDEDADWLLRRRARYMRELVRIETLAEAEMERVSAWRADRAAGAERELAHLDALLEDYMRAVADRSNVSSLSLPSGRLQLRKGRDSVQIDDANALLAWLIDNDVATDDVVRTTQTVSKTGLLKAFADRIAEAEVVDEEAGVELHPLVSSEGERVPGVYLRRPTRKGFNVVTTDPEGDQE